MVPTSKDAQATAPYSRTGLFSIPNHCYHPPPVPERHSAIIHTAAITNHNGTRGTLEVRPLFGKRFHADHEDTIDPDQLIVRMQPHKAHSFAVDVLDNTGDTQTLIRLEIKVLLDA